MNERIKNKSDFPRLPRGMLLYAVGDIHGQFHLLDALLGKIAADVEVASGALERVLVFLGDYIDRGPDSAQVVERLVSGLPPGLEVHCLMGNHEDILLRFLDEPDTLSHWLMNGGGATLASYGVPQPADGWPAEENMLCRDRLLEALPGSHRAFFERLALYLSIGDYVFAHAGIRPGVPLAGQSRDDLLWIRHDFLDSDADFGAVVVHGHTPGPVPVVRANRIGIDTGAWAYGRLTALRLHEGERAFLNVEEEG